MEKTKNENGEGAEQQQLAELYKLGNLQDLLVQYNANNDMISSTYLATRSGWMLEADYSAYRKYSGDGNLPDFFEADTRQWYQRALLKEEGEHVYTDVVESVYEGKDCIICARPIYCNGQIVAVAGIGSYLDTVKETVLNTSIGKSGYAFLVNEKGQVMVSGAEEGETAVEDGSADLREKENTALAKAVSDMVCGGSGLAELTLDGREVYLAYAPLEKLGWSFVTVVDKEEVIAPARVSQQKILDLTDTVRIRQNLAIRRTIGLFLVIVLLAAVLIGTASIVFTGKLTKPLGRLTAEVARIDGGNLDKQIEITTRDEVGELANAFNKMTVQLRSYIGSLATVTAEKERIRTEIQVASRLQADMLPDAEGAFAERADFELYASMTPAKGVGGDFYDFFLLDEDHLALVLADVSGKGVPAALFMVVSRTLIRSRLMTGVDANTDADTGTDSDKQGRNALGDVVAEINNRLCENNKNGMFVTTWIGILTLTTGTITFVNAGHCYPLIRRKDGVCTYETALSGFVLAGMEDSEYQESSIQLAPGDTILLYTDGVTEATSLQKELYGEERLKRTVCESAAGKPREMIAAVKEDVDSFQQGAEQFDDITMLALRYLGDDTPENEDSGKAAPTEGLCRLEGPAMLIRQEEVQRFVEETLENKDVPVRHIRKLLIASDEIFSNICRHSEAKETVVQCGVKDKCAVLIFEDDGIAFDPLTLPKPCTDEPPEERRAGGLGVYMVKELLDEVSYSYENGRNRLSMSIRTDGEM